MTMILILRAVTAAGCCVVDVTTTTANGLLWCPPAGVIRGQLGDKVCLV